jgi:hypothetical protein
LNFQDLNIWGKIVMLFKIDVGVGLGFNPFLAAGSYFIDLFALQVAAAEEHD